MKNFFANMKLRTKLFFSMIGILLLFSGIKVYDLFFLNDVNKLAEVTKTEYSVYAIYAKDFKFSVVQIQQWFTDISLTKIEKNYVEVDKYYKLAKDYLNKFKEMHGKYNHKENMELIKELILLLNEYYINGKKMTDTYLKDDYKKGNILMLEFDAFAGRLSQKVEVLVKYHLDNLKNSMDSLVNKSNLAEKIGFIGLFAVIIIGLLITFSITNYIIKSINAFRDIFLKGASGDLTIKYPMKKVKCWEVRKCNKPECVSYNNIEHLCFFDVGSMAPYFKQQIECPTILKGKLKDCSLCPVYKEMVNNEMHFIGAIFNKFIDSIKTILIEVKNGTKETMNVSSDLCAISEESATSLELMKSNIKFIKDKAINLDNEVNQSNSSAQLVKVAIQDVAKLISTQSSAISASSSSIQQMSASITNIAKETEEKLKTFEELERNASLGENEMKDTMEVINKVAKSASLIMSMITVINNIAEQTNLLAMNAAVEAAHAGNYGKGFAVVASEIRKLSENSSKNSKQISNSLKEITDFIHISEKSTIKTGELFVSIVRKIIEISNSILEMKNSTGELAIASDDIIKTLSLILKITDDVKTSYTQMEEKIENITNSMINLSSISADTKNGMEGIVNSIDEIYIAVEGLAKSGIKNSENVSKLEHLISKFKLES